MKLRASSAKLVLLLAVVGSLALASTEMAKAQMINPFGTYNGPTLGKEDYKLSNAAVEKLLDRKTPTVGAYDTWNNPTSGNHGKFTIREIFTSQGMPCRKVNSSVYYHRSGAHRSFTLDVCKLPSGEWKIVS